MADIPPPSRSDAQPLKLVFMGTPLLAAHILERLLAAPPAEFQISAVITRPDQPRSRGLKLEPSAVGALARRHQIPTLKPTKLRSAEFVGELKALEPDLLVIAAYGRILPSEVLACARKMPINVHASLLPRFRGASPVEAAILAGEAESGITIMRVTERMDAGPILLQRSLALAADETQGSLKLRLTELGADLLLEALRQMRHGELRQTEQRDDLATYTAPVAKEHALIDWGADAGHIERMVRAYNPWPVARTRLGSQELMLWRARVTAAPVESAVAAAGTLVRLTPEPIVRCGEGMLALVEVQAPGRRRMPAGDFVRGRRLSAGIRLGA